MYTRQKNPKFPQRAEISDFSNTFSLSVRFPRFAGWTPLCEYEEAITFSHMVEDVDGTNEEVKAWIYICLSSSYYYIDKINMAEKYLNVLKVFSQFSFVKENMELITGRVEAKKGNTEVAIQQLEKCLMNASHKINIVNVLFDLYLKKTDYVAIEKLIKQEDEFVQLASKNPIKILEHACYHQNKGYYYSLQNCLENSIQCLLESAAIYTKIDRHKDVYHCFEVILQNFANETNQDHKNLKIINKIITVCKTFQKNSLVQEL